MVATAPILLLATLAASAAAQTRTTVYPLVTQYCAILVGQGVSPVPGDCLESSTKTTGSTTVTEVLVTGTVPNGVVGTAISGPGATSLFTLATYYSEITAGPPKDVAASPNVTAVAPVGIASSSTKKVTSAVPIFTGAAVAVGGGEVGRVVGVAAGVVGAVAAVL